MKITFALLVVGISACFAREASSQVAKVTINAGNVSAREIIKQIETQTDYLFVYSKKEVDLSKKATIRANQQTVAEVLKELFNNTDVVYAMEGTNIMLMKKSENVIVAPQERTIKGVIKDKITGETLIGANVLIKGSNVGTVANVDGEYAIHVSGNDVVLVFSFVGYKTEEVVVGDRSVIHVNLLPDTKVMDEVVVTALGIKRASKALSYNVQEVKSDQLNTVKDANFVNALSGKVAGVTINSSSSGVGGASRVVMRGVKSIKKDNNALYVIDGVPMFSTNDDKVEGEYSAQPHSEGIADLNPEDIESITVLTGPSAAALYGNMAANGVIVVNTKKGSADKTRISISNSTMFMKPFVMPEFQNTYGNKPGQVESWGDKLDTPSSYDPTDFFNTGTNVTNSVSLSTGNEKNQTYLSVATTNANGIIPNNKYDRYNFTFRNTTSFLKDKMILDASASYIIQKDRNMMAQGMYYNPLLPVYLFPRGEDFDQVRMFERFDEGRQLYLPYWIYGGDEVKMQNPYWIAKRNLFENEKYRYMLSASLQYKILNWLDVTGRVRIDNANTDMTKKLYAGTHTLFSGEKGFYAASKNTDRQLYADAIVNINKEIADFSIHANIGGSIKNVVHDVEGMQGPLQDIPNFFTLFNIDKNGRDYRPVQSGYHDQSQSVFASLEVGWRNMLYLNVTARNDWESQLAGSAQSSFFYPSIGLSALLSEMISLPELISYMKIRGSYSSVGSPYERFLTFPTYEYDLSTLQWKTTTRFPVGNLEPERTDSWEIGLNTKVWGNRFNLDVTFYRSMTNKQTFEPEISASSGYNKFIIQSGKVRNHGVELTLGFNNAWGNFHWNSAFTYTLNRNKVIELVKGAINPITGEEYNLPELKIAGMGSAQIRLTKGGTMGDLYTTTDLKRDNNGAIKVDHLAGTVSTVSEMKKVGNVLPKYNMGFRNDFSWKGINLGILFTARVGGVVISSTQALMDYYGVSKASAEARDNGGIEVNNGKVSAQNWYQTLGAGGGVASHYVYSATNVRLQELNLGYTLPKSWFGDKMTMSVGFIAKNLWMIYNKAPFDPESTASTNNHFQGIDYFMQPSLRNLGFNVKFQF